MADPAFEEAYNELYERLADSNPEYKASRIKNIEMLEAIRDNNGSIYNAARELGISYQAIWNRAYRIPDMKAAIEEIKSKSRNIMTDVIESTLLDRVIKGVEGYEKVGLAYLKNKPGWREEPKNLPNKVPVQIILPDNGRDKK